MNPAESFRKIMFEVQPEMVNEALAHWQGSDGYIDAALKEVLEMDNSKIDFIRHACVILEAFKYAPDLPIDTVIWHADYPGTKIDNRTVLATSATMEGAIRWAQSRRIDDPKLYRIVVKSTGVKGLAVSSTLELEYEKEILLQPLLKFKKKTPHSRSPEDHIQHYTVKK